MVPVPSGVSAKMKFTLALYLYYIGVGFNPHYNGVVLTKVWNGYISPRSFVPNLPSKVHAAWENTTEGLSISSSNEISAARAHQETRDKATLTDRLPSSNQSLLVGESKSNRVRHCQGNDL